MVHRLIRCAGVTPVLVMACALACARPAVEEAAIGVTYGFGDVRHMAFLQEALDQTRPPGGIRLRIVSLDSAGWEGLAESPLSAEVRRATLLAADPRVIAVVGPGGSREALQVVPIYHEAGLPNILPNVTSRLVPPGPWTFLISPNDSVQGEFIAAFADTGLRARRAAVLYVPDEYGIGLAAGSTAAFAARGVTVLDRIPMRLTLDCYDAAQVGFYRDLVAQLALRGVPDVVVVAARTVESGCVAHALRERWPAVQLVVGDGTDADDQFMGRGGSGIEGTYLVSYWHPSLPSAASRRYVEGFQRTLGRAARHGEAMFYDAVMLAATAVREAGADRAAVRDWLATLGSSRPAFAGITGTIGFEHAHRHALLMTQVRGMSSEVVVGR